MKLEIVAWSIAVAGRAATGLAAALLVVGSMIPLSLPSRAEEGQGRSRAGQPRVSPDGRHIAFVGHMADGSSGLYVIDADGSHMHRLTNGYGGGQAWSPDSSKLVFVRGSEDKPALMVINVDG
ncbi:MAG TPA: hypothetical protein VKF81_07260, partial [Blastocatellia bacterium]|nr:hypothetical protein [Blastocatellia bacterium]